MNAAKSLARFEKEARVLWPASRRVLGSAAALAAGLWLTGGCGKQPVVAEAPAPAPVAAPVTGGQPVISPAVKPAPLMADANGGVDLRELNHAYIGWIVQSHRRPKTFEEFIAQSGMQVAPAPAGRKFVIDRNGFIALTDQ